MAAMSAWFERFGFASVGDGLLAGAYPLDDRDVEHLRRAGVQLAYNLCEDGEYEPAQRARVSRVLAAAGIAERRLPLVDYGGLAPHDLERATEEVMAELDSGRRVYLHCRAGWQRSAAVAAAVVARREDVSLERALEAVRRRKPTADPLPHQREDLRRWWEARDLPGA
jgi:atypical dual specificity phosphatase